MGAMNRVNSSKLTSVDDMGRYLESPGLRGVGGSIWNYFFFSLLLGDNINWGGRVLNSVDQGSPLMRVILYKKWYTMDKSRTYPQILCPTTRGGIY